MPTEEEIIENLRDAGCEESEVRAIITLCREHDIAQAEKLIAGCRRKQLDRMHASQQCIDRLDYLSFQLSKE